MHRKRLQESNTSLAPALISRANACIVLGGCHPSTLWRAEREGVLKAVRIRPNSPSSFAFYRITDIARIAGIDPADVVMQLQAQQGNGVERKRVDKRPRSRTSMPRKRLGGG